MKKYNYNNWPTVCPFGLTGYILPLTLRVKTFISCSMHGPCENVVQLQKKVIEAESELTIRRTKLGDSLDDGYVPPLSEYNTAYRKWVKATNDLEDAQIQCDRQQQ
jgi:hypothetical protein